MSPFLVGSLILVTALIAIGLYRVWAGPTVFDRIVAIALVSVNGVVVMVLLGFVFERPALFIDIALGFALLAFLLPVALGRYFEARIDGVGGDGTPSRRDTASRPTPRTPAVEPHGLLADRARREVLRRGTPRSAQPRRDPASDTSSDTSSDPVEGER